MVLTDGQWTALVNLARKKAGEPVEWINISDAQALTALGLSQRSREGWTITAAGDTALKTRGAAAPKPAVPLTLNLGNDNAG